MKGIIDNKGHLRIERAGTMRLQFCPVAMSALSTESCGDWCPLFGEPYYSKDFGPELEICKKRTLDFTELEDQRVQPEKKV